MADKEVLLLGRIKNHIPSLFMWFIRALMSIPKKKKNPCYEPFFTSTYYDFTMGLDYRQIASSVDVKTKKKGYSLDFKMKFNFFEYWIFLQKNEYFFFFWRRTKKKNTKTLDIKSFQDKWYLEKKVQNFLHHLHFSS